MDRVFTDLNRPPLSQLALRRTLQTPDGPWREIEVVAETGSTNADLVARARAGEASGLVLTTDHQNSGRGRLARTWTAPPRSSIAVSVLLRPDGVPANRLGWLGIGAGVALARTLTKRFGLPARLKWPNDVLVPPEPVANTQDWRKIAGILAEAIPATASAPPAVVIGTGLNVSLTEDELPVPTATSMLLAGAASVDRSVVLTAYLRELAATVQTLLDASGDPRSSGLGAAYRELCDTLGRRVEVHLPSGAVHRGTAHEVDDDGALVVTSDDGGSATFSAGDVVHLRPAQ